MTMTTQISLSHMDICHMEEVGNRQASTENGDAESAEAVGQSFTEPPRLADPPDATQQLGKILPMMQFQNNFRFGIS